MSESYFQRVGRENKEKTERNYAIAESKEPMTALAVRYGISPGRTLQIRTKYRRLLAEKAGK